MGRRRMSFVFESFDAEILRFAQNDNHENFFSIQLALGIRLATPATFPAAGCGFPCRESQLNFLKVGWEGDVPTELLRDFLSK